MKPQPMTAIVLVCSLGALTYGAVRLYGYAQAYLHPHAVLERERQARHARLTREFRKGVR
jgi:hypothetical protein